MPDPSDSSANGRRRDRTPPGLSPIVPGRSGRPSYSLEALSELIAVQFAAETASREDLLLELATPAERRALLNEIADYVLAVEAITLAPADRRRLIDIAYRNLFGFGPLDDLLHDETITEITVEGPAAIHVRHGAGPLEPVSAAFDDAEHLGALLQRVLAGAGRRLSGPFLETGVLLHGRPVRLSVIGPPVRTDYSLVLRLHPQRPLSLQDLQARQVLPAEGVALLHAILADGHGLLIVGDVGLGKTTLAGALMAELATLGDPAQIAIVERAAELHLPPGAIRHTPTSGTPGEEFAAAIAAAAAMRPAWLVIDELRGAGAPEEAAAMWDALTLAAPPRYVWVFRGARQPDRLRSALSILIRQAAPTVPETVLCAALQERLPFVVTLRRAARGPRLAGIAAWQRDPAMPDVLALRPLLVEAGDGWSITGQRPPLPLDLPESFWS